MEKRAINREATIILCVIVFFQAICGFSKGNYFFPEIGFKDPPLKELNKARTHKIVTALKEYKRLFGVTPAKDATILRGQHMVNP